ncbi:hypothetical protein C8R43DRAFT_1138654 [Mycena crocata]|nr:hypothetical protein C8R43DRAFT_1138654 [Mycena crocata]
MAFPDSAALRMPCSLAVRLLSALPAFDHALRDFLRDSTGRMDADSLREDYQSTVAAINHRVPELAWHWLGCLQKFRGRSSGFASPRTIRTADVSKRLSCVVRHRSHDAASVDGDHCMPWTRLEAESADGGGLVWSTRVAPRLAIVQVLRSPEMLPNFTSLCLGKSTSPVALRKEDYDTLCVVLSARRRKMETFRMHLIRPTHPSAEKSLLESEYVTAVAIGCRLASADDF